MNGFIRGTNLSFSSTNSTRDSIAMDTFRKNDLFGLPGRYSSSISVNRQNADKIQQSNGTSSISTKFSELKSPGTQISLGNHVAETSFSNQPSASGTYRELGTIPKSVSQNPSYNLRPEFNFSSGATGTTNNSISGNYNRVSSSLQPNTFPSKLSSITSNTRNASLSLPGSAPVTFSKGAQGPFAKGVTFGAPTQLQSGIRDIWAKQEAQLARNSNTLRNVGTVARGTGVGATIGASAISGPAAALGAISQAVGEGVNSIQNSNISNQISKDYSQNIRQHGVNVGLNSDLIKLSQENTRNYASAGGSIGALFGPIGALVGHAIGSSVSNTSLNLNTAASFKGMIDPTDSRVAQASTTNSFSGTSNLIDNVN